MRSLVIVSISTIGLTVCATEAHAGVHAKVVVGAVVNGIFGGDWGNSRSANDPTWTPTTYAAYPTTATAAAPTELFLYGGVQSVEGSDGSMTLQLRVSYDDLAIDFRGTGFFEQIGSGDETEQLHLDLGTLGGGYRVFHDTKTGVWLEGGMGYVSSVDALRFLGAYGGARVEHELRGEVSLAGEVRYFLMEDDVRILEAVASAQLSILRIGYRIVDFNVGPPLKGPEVGVALTF